MLPMSVGLINCVEFRVEGKLACFGKSDPNKTMNMEERKGKVGLGLKDTQHKKGKCVDDEFVAYFQVAEGSLYGV